MRRFIPTVLILMTLAIGSSTLADIVRLKTGGELRGSIGSADDQQISITTLAGTTLSLPTDAVHFLLRRSDTEEEYETRLATYRTLSKRTSIWLTGAKLTACGHNASSSFARFC